MAADPTPTPESLTGDEVIIEAKKRWQRCSEWESTARIRQLDDRRFANGDDINGYQWPNNIRQNRGVDDRPCLTMNVVQQHNFQIVNEAKRNKSAIKIVPLGNGATAEAANVWRAMIRHVEYQSNAQAAYSTAREFQVEIGRGWWRLVTDYAGEDTFDQDLFIRIVRDPLSVYPDPDAQEKDKSDMKFAFVFDTIPTTEFDQAYPKYKGLVSQEPLGVGTVEESWVSKDTIRLCEYFRKVVKKDKLISFVVPGTGERKTIKKSLLKGFPKEELEVLLKDQQTMIRDLEVEEVQWKLIAGEQVIDETVWPGKYIPLVPCTGLEVVVDGTLDIKGHTRSMRDAQRMYNYNASSQVEFVALQGKTPWVAPAKAIEELESMWNTANTVNHSVLIYNHVDDNNPDVPIPPPQRTEPPRDSPAYQAGMETAFNQMMMTSGQWQNQMGMGGNERTGKAISERQEQSDTSTYHFQDNYGESLKLTGKMILDVGPKIWDTRRVVKILADDGTDEEVELDPKQKQAFVQHLDHQGNVIRRIFNPLVGKYDVGADVGAVIGSRRQETVEALTLILTQAPALTGIIGDLLLKAMDFEEAQEAAQRLRRMVPPQALGQGPTQLEQELQMQVQALQQALTKSLEKQGKEQLKLVGKSQMRDIDVYKAETDRFKALADSLPMDQKGLVDVIHELVQEALSTHLTGILSANKDDIDEQSESPTPGGPVGPGGNGGGNGAGVGSANPGGESAPIPGARKAPDGEYYLADPTRPGKYLRVGGLASQGRPNGARP
jgi:hypothetical protein